MSDARAESLVQQYGHTGIAFQALSPGMRHWFDRDESTGLDRGLVAYADTGHAWVVAGEPIAPRDQVIAVAERFVSAAHTAGRRACFFATEGALASSPHFRRVQIGEQPVWDPQRWQEHVGTHRSLREQLRRARAKGVAVRRVTGDAVESDPALRAQLDRVVGHWLSARSMPPMHFLVEVAPLAQLAQRRMYVAERGGRVVALLSLAPVPARGGWLFEHLLRDSQAPNGTSELLVDDAMRSLSNDGVTWATLGLAPLAGNVPRWMQWTRTIARPLFNFAGLSAFKRKLRPQQWEPMFLAYPQSASSALALADGLRAFAGGTLWRFGVRTVFRGPRPLLVLLEWLLLPWTIALALAPTSPWFPDVRVHIAWVLFDLGLYVLLRLVRTRAWTAGARAAAAAVSLDALLTAWQAAAWNMSRTTTWMEALLIGIAVTGPLLIAPMLWGAARRLRGLTSH